MLWPSILRLSVALQIEDSDEDASQPLPRFHSKTRRGSRLATAPPAAPQPRSCAAPLVKTAC